LGCRDDSGCDGFCHQRHNGRGGGRGHQIAAPDLQRDIALGIIEL
jgi:hypothetical protein